MGEEIFVRLRDCFTAGYMLPQYCIDNGIKKPLFVSEKKYELFMWEIYVQFCFDKRFSINNRLVAKFSFLDEPNFTMNHFVGTLPNFESQEFSQELLESFDKVFVFSTDKNKVKSDKAIYIRQLLNDFVRKAYYEIPVLNFLQRNPKVKLITTSLPSISRYKDGLDMQKQLPTYASMMIALINRDNNFKNPLEEFGYTRQESMDITRHVNIKENNDGTTTLRDNEKTLVRVKNGKRMTAYQPEKFLNKIYIIGSCHAFGIQAPYDKTIASYLQKFINEANLPYRVENEGQSYWAHRQDIFYNLNKLNPAPGDIVLALIESPPPKNLPFCDVSDAFDPPHDYKKMFSIQGHVNELGYKLMAEKYFKFLTENNFFRDLEFNYPIPPPLIIDMAYLLGSSKAA